MSSRPRPVLLGYIRADVLRSASHVERVEAQLFDFADREKFSLGTVYVERGLTAPAFHSLMTELSRDAAWGVVIPDMLHLTDAVRQVLRGHDVGVQTRIVVVQHGQRVVERLEIRVHDPAELADPRAGPHEGIDQHRVCRPRDSGHLYERVRGERLAWRRPPTRIPAPPATMTTPMVAG
ncbi:hypothetical protein GCM10009844_17040 [Nocardioides koreensis]|uniref:Resolvase/invertase-type recombinase catalytic domain-containing protein n=1 Tax=Nocardioides koreensis TaxID=433651 RepID=A0ABP5LC09_9ACTN